MTNSNPPTSPTPTDTTELDEILDTYSVAVQGLHADVKPFNDRTQGASRYSAEAKSALLKWRQEAIPVEGCYCICHSGTSSCPSCPHCNGQYLRGLQEGEKAKREAITTTLEGLLEQAETISVPDDNIEDMVDLDFVQVSAIEKAIKEQQAEGGLDRPSDEE